MNGGLPPRAVLLDPGRAGEWSRALVANARSEIFAVHLLGFNEHAKTSPLFDELLVDEFLVGFEDSERIDSILGCDIAHRRQRIAFFEDAVENHMDDAITKLAVNRLTIIPFTVHDSSNVPDSVGEGGSRHCSVRLLPLIW